MSEKSNREIYYEGMEPGELASEIVRNYDDQRDLLSRLDELENEAIDLRNALAPAFCGWDVSRLLILTDRKPRLMLIHKRVNGGIEVTIHDVERADDLSFPERRPDPPETSLPDGINDIDHETS